jgi:hypothetical protein
VHALAFGELLVQLGRLRVDEVRGELAGVATEERVRERAVAPEEPGQCRRTSSPAKASSSRSSGAGRTARDNTSR